MESHREIVHEAFLLFLHFFVKIVNKLFMIKTFFEGHIKLVHEKIQLGMIINVLDNMLIIHGL